MYWDNGLKNEYTKIIKKKKKKNHFLVSNSGPRGLSWVGITTIPPGTQESWPSTNHWTARGPTGDFHRAQEAKIRNLSSPKLPSCEHSMPCCSLQLPWTEIPNSLWSPWPKWLKADPGNSNKITPELLRKDFLNEIMGAILKKFSNQKF